MKKVFTSTVVLFLLAGCPKCPSAPVADAWDSSGIVDFTDAGDAPIVISDATVEFLDGAKKNASCVKACAKLAEFGCPEGKAPDAGDSCYFVCANAEASGKFGLKPDCIAAAKTAVELQACKTVRCKK